MKILLVIHFFPPKHNSGSENATYFLATELAKDHEVTVFTSEPDTDKDGFHEVYIENNFRVIKIHKRLTAPGKIRDTYLNEKVDRIFEKYLDEIKPDVVHFQHLIILSLNFIRMAESRNIPIVYTLHDFWFECPQIKKYFQRKNCLFIDDGRCGECIKEHFPSVADAEIKYKDDFFTKGIIYLSQKRFFKKLANYALDKLALRRLLHKRGEGAISRRKKDFLNYFKDVDIFITPSRFLAVEAVKFGISQDRIITIPHGIPIPDPYPSVVHSRNRKNKIVFCFMSHIIMEKGFFLLLDSFKRLQEKYKNVGLILYGTYDKGNVEISEAIKEIENEKNIKYGGEFSNKEVGKVLSEVDVTVIPSLWQEIYGLVLDESFLYGVPIIVSNRGAMPERVRNGKNGFIFDPEKEGDLYEKMATITKNPDILDNLKGNIPKMKSIEKYAEEIEKLYLRLVGKN